MLHNIICYINTICINEYAKEQIFVFLKEKSINTIITTTIMIEGLIIVSQTPSI